MLKRTMLLIVGLLLILSAGCTGVKTFPNAVRAGDTLTVGVGYNSGLTRYNTAVKITAWGDPLTSVDDVVDLDITSTVRAILYFYPDPTSHAANYTAAALIGSLYYEDAKQGMVMVDLPDSSILPPGLAEVTVTSSAAGFSPVTSSVKIIAGNGQPSDLSDVFVGGLPLNLLEPLPQAEVTFTSPSTIGAAEIEIDFDQALITPDEIRIVSRYFSGGMGTLFQQNQNMLFWDDDGDVLRVKILCPQGISDANYLKFNVVTKDTPAAAPLAIVPGSVKIFDLNGTQMPQVSATLTLLYQHP